MGNMGSIYDGKFKFRFKFGDNGMGRYIFGKQIPKKTKEQE